MNNKQKNDYDIFVRNGRHVGFTDDQIDFLVDWLDIKDGYEDVVMKSEYRCGKDKRPRWVTFDSESGEIINDEIYNHQDGNYSELCASDWCRCQQ